MIVELYRCAARQGFAIACRDVVFRRAHAGVFDPAAFAEDAEAEQSGSRTRSTSSAAPPADLRRRVGPVGLSGKRSSPSLPALAARPLASGATHAAFRAAGIDALPITLLIGFLIGLILAFLSAAIAQTVRREVYVAT
jgi:hypothetical protein